MAEISPASELRYRLHAKQTQALETDATEVLYGGAAGAAKSHLIRVAAIAWCSEIPGLQVYLFRRIREDLIKNHMEGPTGFRSMLAPLLGDYVEIVEDEIRFWNGSRIYLCHCKDEKDRFKYQGAEIHVLLIDELTHFTEVIYRFLRSRVRMPSQISIQLPEKYRGRFPRILCGTNPGGIGHQFVKMTFVDPKPAYEKWLTTDQEGGFVRQFIPARLSDNPSIDYKAYAANLSGLGNEALVKAMLEGDWDIVAGAALSIDRQVHLLRPFVPPKHWTKFTSLDWGYVKPYCHGWYCVAEGNTLLRGKDGHPDVYLPDGAVVKYRELYGWNGKPNEGCKEESPTVARQIIKIERDADEHIDYRIADTQLWAKNDGPSMYERMYQATDGLFNPGKAEKDRQANYSEICNRLRGNEVEEGVFEPMFYITENCTHFWRTVPSLILDELHPERGPDEDQENHSYDETVYGLMSRPFIRTVMDRHHAYFSRLRRENKLDGVDPYRIRKQTDKRYAGRKK